MNNTTQIRQLLRRKVVAAKNVALHTNDFLIPVEDRYIISMSIQEVEQILALLPCYICGDTGYILELIGKNLWQRTKTPCPDCQPS